MGARLTFIFAIVMLSFLASCTKDNEAPVVDYFIINGQSVSQSAKADKGAILQLKISVTDEGGLAMHSLHYIVNNEFGEELIYISDEIVNTIVEEFYVDLSELEKNELSYSCISGDIIEFSVQAEDLSGNILDRSFEVQIK
jgi:hypothetical protein